jgi:hypothetical protein
MIKSGDPWPQIVKAIIRDRQRIKKRPSVAALLKIKSDALAALVLNLKDPSGAHP